MPNQTVGPEVMQKADKYVLSGVITITAILMTTNGASAAATIDSGAKPYFIAGGVIATIFFISVGAILIRKGNRCLRIAAAAAQWPVDGVSRDGSIIRVGMEDRGYLLEQHARDYVAKYSVGSDVPVRYDPQNPANAVLELGQFGGGSNLLAGILLTLVGVGGVAFTVFSIVAPGN